MNFALGEYNYHYDLKKLCHALQHLAKNPKNRWDTEVVQGYLYYLEKTVKEMASEQRP